MNNPPVIVFSSGKNGTYTIYESLKRHNIYNLYRAHTLTIAGIIDYEQFKGDNFRASFERETLKFMCSNYSQIRFIIPIRDLFEREISSFFHNFSFDSNLDIKTKDIKKEFLKKSNWEYGIGWMDREVELGLDLKIYQKKFDIYKGYTKISNENYEALIIRMEDINRIGEFAIKDFLELDSFSLTNLNQAFLKYYSDIYIKFINEQKFNKPILDIFYKTEFMKNFYGEKYINDKYKFWRNDC